MMLYSVIDINMKALELSVKGGDIFWYLQAKKEAHGGADQAGCDLLLVERQQYTEFSNLTDR